MFNEMMPMSSGGENLNVSLFSHSYFSAAPQGNTFNYPLDLSKKWIFVVSLNYGQAGDLMCSFYIHDNTVDQLRGETYSNFTISINQDGTGLTCRIVSGANMSYNVIELT